ncbi:MAG: type II toxin-antitoxin system RelE/ParE family toxin [Desulfovibrionaceae bacterium]
MVLYFKSSRWCAFHSTASYFSHPVGKHLIFYRIEDEKVTIVRILHQSMDVGRQL